MQLDNALIGAAEDILIAFLFVLISEFLSFVLLITHKKLLWRKMCFVLLCNNLTLPTLHPIFLTAAVLKVFEHIH